MFKTIDINNIPQQVNKEKIEEKAHQLSSFGIFQNHTITSLKYLGGCSNHALVAKMDDDAKKLLVRLPGSQSDRLIDRVAEKHNTTVVMSLGLSPKMIESDELNGFKVEEFLEGESLNFDNFNQYAEAALVNLKKVHDCKTTFLTEYNIFDRIILMCETLRSNGINYLSYDNRKQTVLLEDIIYEVTQLKEFSVQYFNKPDLVPCHNDISPFNFMVVKSADGKEEIKIIDWEYSGMNDRMVDLAYIASENGYRTRSQIEKFLKLYFQSEELNSVDVDKVLFYVPLIDLKVSVWSLMQVHMRNESKEIDGLRKTWGPDRFKKFEQGIQSTDYLEVLDKNRTEDDATKSPYLGAV